MDDDEFAELYGTSAVDEPVQRPSAAAVNGVAAHHLPRPAVGRDDFEDLYGQSYVDDAPAAHPPSQLQAPYAAAGASATPFAAPAALQNNSAVQPLQHQQHIQHQAVLPAAAAAPKPPAATAADDDDEDFEILVDDDNGPTPAPVAAAPSAVFPKPPVPPAAAVAGAVGAGSAGLTASGRLSSTHLHYMRPGLEAQGSLGTASLSAAQHGQPHHHQHPQALGQGLEAGAQRQGSVLSGFTAAALGAAAGQQYSLPLPGVSHPLPGPPAVPGPRPPAAPYPGPPPEAAAGAVPGPRPPPGAPPELNFIPMGQAGFQIAAAWRDVDAAFPSAAGPQQPIKLPRQHNVDKDEYKEFLNLGHGEIFNLDLDRVTTAPWRAAGADISDFFNYGLTEKSWRQYMRQVAKYRAAYTINNKIEILSSERTEDDLEGLPREIVAAVRVWRLQHPNKDTPTNNSNNPNQFLPRARGRDYKRVADTSVVLTLVTAEEGPPGPEVAPSSRRGRAPVAGEYDGPLAGDCPVSGVPDLPPATVGPPSPSRAPPPPPAHPPPGAAAALKSATSGMQQHKQQPDVHQQLALRQRSIPTPSHEGHHVAVQGKDGQMPGGAAAGTAMAGEMQMAGVQPGRGVQVKLAARAPVEEQPQQEQQQQQFMDESEMMAEYYNEQLQHQASVGIPQPDWAPDDDDFDFEEGDGFGQLGMAGGRGRDHADMMLLEPGAQQQHLEDLDEFDDFTNMGQQQQQQMGMFSGRAPPPAALMGMGGFGGGMSLPDADIMRGGGRPHSSMPGGGMTAMTRAGNTLTESGMVGHGQNGAAAAGIGPSDWELDDRDVQPQQQQRRQQRPTWDAETVDEQQQRQQQPVFDDGYDGQGGFMGAEGYDGDVGFGGAGMGEAAGADDWTGGPIPGAGLPPNACFNCGGTDHIARNCPHPKHFNITCHNCGEMGHRAKECKAPKRPPPGADQRCFKCGQEGHIARECPHPPRLGPGGPDRPWGPGPPPPHFGPPAPPPPPRPAGDRPPPLVGPAGSAGAKPDSDDAGYGARGGPRSGVCFKCGGEGHLARECPNPPASPPPEREGLQPPTCFKCGGEGHYARECTVGRPGPPRGGEDRWDGGASLDRSGPPPPHRLGPGLCYNCGQEGHIARECPAPPRGAPPPPRGPPPLPPPRSVFDRLGGGRGPGPWDGPPPGRFETPEERAAREAEIDRRLRMAEGVEGGRTRDSSPARGPTSSSGRGVSSRDKDREREKEKEVVKRSSRSAAADEDTRSSRAREDDERRSSRQGSSRDRKRSRSSRSPDHKREHKKKEKHSSSKRDNSRSLSRSPGRDKDSKRSSKHSSRHRSHSKSRSHSRGRHRR